MRMGLLASTAALLLGAGGALAESPPAGTGEKLELAAPADVHQEAVSEDQPSTRFWADAEYLLWWIKDTPTPPLVSLGSPATRAIPARGASVVFGGEGIDNEERMGGRFTAGCWLDDHNSFGIEGSYLFLAARSVHFGIGASDTPGSPAIGRPFFNIDRGIPDAELVAFPGLLSGRVEVNASSRLQGAEANGVINVCCNCDFRLDLLAGFRYLQLREGLGIAENLAADPAFGGSRFLVTDQFDTANDYYGGQIGARAEYRHDRWSVKGVGKIAFGDTREGIQIRGSTLIAPPGELPMLARGGLLALPTNIGKYHHDDFAVVPEVSINVGYQVTNHLKAFAGYSFLYWSSVGRPGDQIDPGIDVSRLPINQPVGGPLGPARPAFAFKETDFWAQGINFGLEFRY